MADLTITATNVVAGSNAVVAHGIAGETITAGQAVYLSSTTNKWLLADADSATAEARRAGGIALNSASASQPIAVQKEGDITIGATVTAGTAYYLSDEPGGICPVGDLASGDYVCLIGIAKSASVLSIGIQFPNVAIPE